MIQMDSSLMKLAAKNIISAVTEFHTSIRVLMELSGTTEISIVIGQQTMNVI